MNKLLKIPSKKTLQILISFGILFLILVPLLILSQYNHPICWDDYLTMTSLREGYIRRLTSVQRASTFFSFSLLYNISPIPTIENMNQILTIYHWTSVIYIFLFFSSIFCFLFLINKYILHVSKINFFSLYTILIFLIVNTITGTAEVFYNHTITTGYTGGMIAYFILLSLICLFWFDSNNKKRKIILFLCLMVQTMFVSGFVEFYVLLAGFTFFFVFMFQLVNNKKFDFFALFFLLLTVIIFISFFSLSPENTQPKYNIEEETFLSRILKWIPDVKNYIIETFVKIFSIKLFPLYVLFATVLANNLKIQNKFKLWQIILMYCVIPLMSLAGCYGGLWWAAHYIYIQNMVDIIFSLLTIILFSHIIYLVNRTLHLLYANISTFNSYDKFLNDSKNLVKNASYKIVIVVTILAIFYFLNITIFSIGLPIRQTWKDVLMGYAKSFDEEMLHIYKKIILTSDKFIEIEPISKIPRSICTKQGCYFSDDNNVFSIEHPAFEDFFGKKIFIKGTTTNE